MSNIFSKYPICDTDIWVNLVLGDMLGHAFQKYKKIVFADVVEGEILAWSRDSKFSHISSLFEQSKRDGTILVIQHDVDISQPDRLILEDMLYQLNFKHDFRNKPPEKNKGEFVSAIYAQHFGIPFMKTNDGAFQIGGKGRSEFPDLAIKNWYEIVEDLVTDSGEMIRIRSLVEKERQRMNNHKTARQQKKKDDLLKDLAKKFNNSRL